MTKVNRLLYLLALLHLEVAVDNIDAEVLRRGKQRQNAVLSQGADDETLLIDEAVGHDLTVVGFR